jgi:hypothetical protein
MATTVIPRLAGTGVQWSLDSSGNPVGIYGPNGEVVYSESKTVVATSGSDTGFSTEKVVAAESNSTAINIAKTNKTRYTFDGVDITGSGHIVGGLDWIVHEANGTIASAYPHEAKLDISGGGTITVALLNEAQVASNDGNITTLIGHRAAVTGNTGTIGYFAGFYFPDHAAVSGITTKRSFKSDDAAAHVEIKGMVISQALYAISPTSGSTETVPDGYSDYVMIPGGTLATLTLNMPANPIDGQELCVKTTQAITTLTHQGNGKTLLDALTTMAAGSYATYRYIGASTTWYRKG